jgi:hypothetical protein
MKYRFFYHYRRSTDGVSVHFRGKCIPCANVKCNVPCESKRNKQQPRWVMQGFCKEVLLTDSIAIIQ